MFKRPLIWILAAFFLVCLFHGTRTNLMDELFEDEIQGTVYGRIDQITKKDTGISFYLKDVSIYPMDAKKFYCNKILVYSSSKKNLLVGNLVSLSGKIMKFQRPTNPGQFNEEQYYKSNHVEYKMIAENIQITDNSYSKTRAMLDWIREKMVSSYCNMLDEKDAGIIDAMLLGEKSLLDSQTKELYQNSGISHILVISGLNISLIGLALYRLLSKIGVHQIPNSILTMLLVFYYGLLTEFSVSTNRAVVMLLLAMVAAMFGRTYDLRSAAAFSAIIILFQSPLQFLNSGFLLSFGAILGITYLVPAFQLLFPENKELKGNKNKIKQVVKEGFILSISTNLMTLPIILYYFYEIPLYSVLINILIIPFSSLLVILAMIGGIVGCFSPLCGMFFMGGVHTILVIIEFICNCFSKLPYHTIIVGRPNILLVYLYYGFLTLFVILINKFPKKVNLLVLCFLLIILIPQDDHKLQFTFLDVGQGDGIVVETPEEKVYLIDGGSSTVKQVGNYRIIPYLKFNGIGQIDAIIVTHGDEDHTSGLSEIIEDRSIHVNRLVVPAVPLEESNLVELVDLAQKNKIDVVYIKKGDTIIDGKVNITCLHPDKSFRTASVNAYSTVLEFSYRSFQGLFVGDLEGDGEEALNHLIQYDILKVAHHGSKNSTSVDFLQKTQPKLSVISCGKKNRYGHPHQELLERLDTAGSKIVITSNCGAITVKTDGKTMGVSTYR